MASVRFDWLATTHLHGVWTLERLGMLGFSAGGHLILATALADDQVVDEPGNSDASDGIDALDCRPNFLVPVYAVTNGEGEVARLMSICLWIPW